MSIDPDLKWGKDWEGLEPNWEWTWKDSCGWADFFEVHQEALDTLGAFRFSLILFIISDAMDSIILAADTQKVGKV